MKSTLEGIKIDGTEERISKLEDSDGNAETEQRKEKKRKEMRTI